MAVTYDHSATGTQLIADVREYGGYKDLALPDDRALVGINAGIVRAAHLITRYAPERANQTATINVVSGTATHTIPPEMGMVTIVAIKDSKAPSGYRKLPRINQSERYETGSTNVSRETVSYDLEGGLVYLYPTPNWTETAGLLLAGQRNPPRLVLVADNWDGLGVHGWREYVVLHALTMVAAHKDDNAKDWKALRDEAAEQLIFNARLDAAQPKRISNTVSHRRRRRTSWDF